jgi:hypothetical protein
VDRIIIESKPFAQMRYPTTGDWYEKNNNIHVDTILTDDWRVNISIAIHNIIEKFLCDAVNIKGEDVDAYSKAHHLEDDPGLNPDAPHHDQHMLADKIERIIHTELGLSRKKYEYKINQFCE